MMSLSKYFQRRGQVETLAVRHRLLTTKHVKRLLWAFGVISGICFAASGPAFASHNHIEDDFEASISSGWSSTQTAAYPFGGGNYLGTFGVGDSVWLGIMDALPAELGTTGFSDDSSRSVSLSFDIVNPSTTAYDFIVEANGKTVLNEQANPVFPTSVTTTFQLDSIAPNPTDLILEFYPGGVGVEQKWGIDNVVVDWSRPVPEPGTGLCAIVASILLLLPGRKRH